MATGTNAVWVFNTVDQNPLNIDGDRFISDTRSDFDTNTYALFNSKVTVTYRGIVSTVTIANPNNRLMTDLDLNQAIKKAINLDPVLSKLLVATDAESNALHVTSLTDGLHTVNDLGISLTAPTTGLSTGDINAIAKAFGVTADAASVYAAMAGAVTAFGLKGDYASAFATAYAPGTTNFVELAGDESAAISDNIVSPGTGNDVIVLGNKEVVAVDLNAPTSAEFAVSNNETVVYAPAFGNDTILNFDVTGAGIDHLDFTALGGTTLTSTVTTDKSITIGTAVSTALTNAELVTLFNANNDKAQTHVYVAVDSVTSIGSVYQIADAVGANNAVVTLAGTIDLADTLDANVTSLWNQLTQRNFVNSSGDYFLAEGAAGGAPAAIVPPTSASVVLGGSGAYNAGNNTNVTFNVPSTAVGTSTVSNYAAGDKFVFATGTVVTVADTQVGDGTVVLTATNGGNVETITVVTQAPAVIGTLVDSVAAFNTFFGANSITVSAAPSTATPINAQTTTVSAAGADITFDVAKAAYTAEVAGFATNDILRFVNGTTLTVNPGTAGDGIVDVVALNGGVTTTIHLTGVLAASDTAGLNTVAAFNTAFGPGALTVL